jgi:hypothetical protein
MNTTHTPGPWTVLQGEPFQPILIGTDEGGSFIEVGPACGLTEGTGSMEANAALIAAAPDLLEALHHILNIEGACFAADESEWNTKWHWDKVRAAIAKAEGWG